MPWSQPSALSHQYIFGGGMCTTSHNLKIYDAIWWQESVADDRMGIVDSLLETIYDEE